MKRFYRIISIMTISILLFTMNVLAAEGTSDDIYLTSTSVPANLNSLYSIDAQGVYSGFKLLKGYPNDNEFEIYYSGDINSYSVTTRDLRGLNLEEVITWSYNNVTYRNTRRELFNYFYDLTWLRNDLGISSGILSLDWIAQTFGSTYSEWFQGMCYSQDAERLVDRYLRKNTPVEVKKYVELLPETKIEVKSGQTEYSDGNVFYEMVDPSGKSLVKYSNYDDMNLLWAKYNKAKELPPLLSNGWISIDLMNKISYFQVKLDGNDLVFYIDESGYNYKEVLRLDLPEGWSSNDSLEAKANGVKLKKYIQKEKTYEHEWIDTDTLYRDYGIICSIGNSINDFRLFGQYDISTQKKPLIFEGSWPEDWQTNNSQKEATVDGLSIKRENNMDYFKVEDLAKLKAFPEGKTTRTIYINLEDLQNVGLIK